MTEISRFPISNGMKIGVFDSGLGGLYTMRYVIRALPSYDYIYLGDTLRVPYGNRSPETIYKFLKESVEYLFAHDCELIIVACNTASAQALRRIQQEYLPKKYPDRKVLGITIPIVEAGIKNKRVGIIGTKATIRSRAYVREFKKHSPKTKVFMQPTPLLVPLIEAGKYGLIGASVKRYTAPLIKKNIDALVLGCTHYGIIKKEIRRAVPKNIKLISQDAIIGKSLKNYLTRHPEIDRKLSKKSRRIFLVTKKTAETDHLSKKWFGENMKLKVIDIL